MDFSYLNAIGEGDLEFIQEFVSTFESNNETILAEMQTSLSNRDFDKLGKLAHQLKPTIEMLGMKETLEKVTKMNDQPASVNQGDLDFVVIKANDALVALKTEYNVL
ncbi:MAG: HPt (histidine-containing phosphotransfer) domain-containing protein [Cyclobacteriaceae bacterium]|jgi:HPt (histidine-containing phosphotransfer) domain-containing protein